MSVKTVFAALAFATVAGAAAAQAISPGMVQMSNQLGVVPGTLTLAELSQLANAKRENDAEAIRFITSGASGLSKSTMNAAGSSAGADQLAAIAGVAPGQYTPNELIRLHQAQIDGDRDRRDPIGHGRRTQQLHMPSEQMRGDHVDLAIGECDDHRQVERRGIGVDPRQRDVEHRILDALGFDDDDLCGDGGSGQHQCRQGADCRHSGRECRRLFAGATDGDAAAIG